MIRIETEYPVSISTDQPVRIKTEGGITTMTIEGAAPDKPASSGLVHVQREDPTEGLLPPQPPNSDKPRCGQIMKRSKKPCARVEGHKGVHMNAQQIQTKRDYNKDRTRNLYANNPEYAEKVKAASRDSWERRHQKDEGDNEPEAPNSVPALKFTHPLSGVHEQP